MDPSDFTIMPQDELDPPRFMPRTQPKNRDARSYFNFLLEQIDETRGPKYKYGIILIPLRHLGVYLSFLGLLIAFLFLFGFVIWRIAIPDGYMGPSLDFTLTTFGGYVALSGFLMIFVIGSWVKLVCSILCCGNSEL